MITILILLVALGILGWGFYRAQPLGKLGILAWSQSAVLMAPWLIFFGLFAAGIYLNLAGVLLLIITSIGLYIFLGNKLRAEGKKVMSQQTPITTTSVQEVETNNPRPEVSQEIEATSTQSPQPQDQTADLPEIVPIPAEDLKVIQSVFGIDTFFATETIPYQQGAIFKGNMRGGDPEAVHSKLSDSLKQRMGDQYRLFLIENPEGKPVVIVLPSSNDPQPTTLVQKGLAAVLAVGTIATSMETGGLIQGFDYFGDVSRYAEVLPLAWGILAVLAAHEIGHRVLAQRYQVRLSLPFFIPTWQIGSFGALTRFESILPDRKTLFDISFAGPAAGGIVSLAMLILGLILSHPGSLFQVPSDFFQGSILVGALARVVLGSALQQSLVDVHPLMVVGWLGLVITALNLMPAGQLDGGRIVQAIYGRKVAGRATIATLILLGLASLVNPLALYWAIIILFLQRDLERPSLNELTEPDDARAALGLLVLFLMVATLLPLTPSLAGRLGIGG